MAAGRRRRHHFVPEFYLKRFADSRGLIAVMDHLKREAFETAPRRAGAELDLYTVETEAGPNDSLEDWLKPVEDDAAAAMRIITDGPDPMSDHDRSSLANFLALQLTRVPLYRILLNAVATAAVRDALNSATAASNHDVGGVGGFVDAIRGGEPTAEVPKAAAILHSLHSAERLVEPLFRKSWHILAFSEPLLTTSDNPVVVVPPGELTPQLIRTSEVSLAVDPRHLLILGSDGPTTYDGQDEESARIKHNDRVKAACARFTYGRPPVADLEPPEPDGVGTALSVELD